MRLGESAGAESLAAEAPDLVVVATGSVPVLRPAPRIGAAIPEIGPYDAIRRAAMSSCATKWGDWRRC